MHFLRAMISVVFLAGAIGCSGPNRAEVEGWDLETADCHFDSEHIAWTGIVECYRMEVPETRGAKEGRTIQLGVYLVKANRRSDLPPIVHLLGGPGESAEGTLMALVDHPIREIRDVIILEQRGAGVSVSFCERMAPTRLFDIEPLTDNEFAWEIFLGAIEACFHEGSENGVDVASYNTDENASDVAALRQALNLETMDTWGVSYGTTLAQAYMQLEPGRIGSVLFDATFDIDLAWEETIVSGFANALENSWNRCLIEGFCEADEATFTERLFSLIAVYDETPVALTVLEDVPDAPQIQITGEDVLSIVHSAMYASHAHVSLPHVFDQLEVKSEEFLLERMAWFFSPWFSEGMFYSMRCQLPRASDDEIAYIHSTYGEIAALMAVEDLNTLCTRIGLESAPPPTQPREAFMGPILFMTGEWDPISPLSLTSTLHDEFPNASHLEVPYGGHGTSLWLPCARELVRDYFANGTTDLTTSCAPDLDDYPSVQVDG